MAQPECIAFDGSTRVAVGSVPEVVARVKEIFDRGDRPAVQIFDYTTSEPIDVDLSGTADDVLRRLEARRRMRATSIDGTSATALRRSGPGRPKLGVIAREVTLLPRHWEWLATQRGGASATLRRLVDDARRGSTGRDRSRRAQESTYRFIVAVGGDYPGFEEATRALFAQDGARFARLIDAWPPDVRAHALELATDALASTPSTLPVR
jgi:uncharacterized protein